MKEFFAGLGVAIALVSYVPYFWDMFTGKTKPHAFTWFIWFLLTGIAFFAQLADGGGVGSVVLGITAFISFFIFIVALRYGKRNIVRLDWYFLAASLASLALWAITEDPVWSVILITVVDAIAFAPTFRKSYKDPYSETLSTYLLSSVKFVFAIAALEAYSTTTVLYPASLVLANGLFVIMLVIRRRAIKESAIIKE